MVREHIRKMLKHNTERVMEIIEEMADFFGDEVFDYFDCHIRKKECYDKYVSFFKNFDGTKGAHWSEQIIESKAGIDFSNKEYTLYDYAYVVNMKYSDEGDLMSVENLFKSAQRYLEDQDYYGNPSERAYFDAKKRMEYFE